MSNLKTYAILALTIIVCVLISYGLARAGEPQSVWLWSHFR